MKLKHIKLKGYKELIDCFLIEKGNKWGKYYYNPIDFTLDGIIFIQNKFILSEKKGDIGYDEMKETIFNLKIKKIDSFQDIEELDDTKYLFKYLQEAKKLVGIKIKNESSLFIGKILTISDASIYIKLLSVSAKWLNEENFKFNEIRMILLDTDYMNSLELYLRSQNNL